MIVLGISESHNTTAALLRDGEILGCVSEERFNRVKNTWEWPIRSAQWLCQLAGIEPREVDLVVLSMINPIVALNDPGSQDKTPDAVSSFVSKVAPIVYETMNAASKAVPAVRDAYNYLYKTFYQPTLWPKLTAAHNDWLCRTLGVTPDKILRCDHHDAHAAAVYWSFLAGRDALVMTHDGSGDKTCATIRLARNGALEEPISTTPNGNSLAYLYGLVTRHMGMKPGEHEYKLMGMAPYASDYEIKKVYGIFEKLVWIENLQFKTNIHNDSQYESVCKLLQEKRFDGVAGAMQRRTEDLLVEWVTRAVERTGQHRVALSGGVFMNVKANKRLMELPGVAELHLMPSAGDESNAIGACYWGYDRLCRKLGKTPSPKPLANLYLGPEHTDAEVQAAIREAKREDKYTVRRADDVDAEVAQMLAEGKIVARHAGRMEFGARALGNRSILANPSDARVIRVINEQIKSRDFWMPFAGTVLAERAADYIAGWGAKPCTAAHMMLSFDTTPLGRQQLPAAIHPYDFTIRPQILEPAHNPRYHRLIREFEKRTGIGAVLNTSFNLHGEPVVCSPADSISTFERSGLQHLAVENWLISKKT